MTKISKKAAYPVKIPVRKDYFVGTDSENNGKTVNFDFESTAKLINELNGTPVLNYIFRTDSNIDLTVLTEGVFLSADNETTITNISKLYVNKNNFHETNMSDLFRFISTHREVFFMKLRNSSNLANSVYFKITDATEFESYFILDVSIELNNIAIPELINYNVYFFDFELASQGSIDIEVKLDKGDYPGNAGMLDDRITSLEGEQSNANRFTGRSYALWSGTGLVYDVIYTSFYLDNVLYSGGTVQCTLSASDPTNPRFDLIAVDATGAIVIPGTASSSPEVPTADPNTQLAISPILVEAGATTPVGVVNEDVYKENVEWTAISNNGTVNLNATSNPFQGTKHIDCGAFTNGQYLRFTDTVVNQIADFSLLKFYVNLKTTFANTAKFSIKFYNGTTLVSSVLTVNSGSYNFLRTTINSYQTVIIPLSDFTFSSSSFNRIEIVLVGANGSGFRMDNIVLSQGSGSSSSEQNAITSIITDSGIANATVKDDAFQFKGANGLLVSAIGKIITFTSNFTTALKTNYDTAYTWVSTNGANVVAHLSRTDNPHGVIASQVGLGNVDNISDANKPVSTAQAAADAATLASAQSYAANLITQLINGAPADANTLKELSDKIIAINAIIGGTAADGDSIVNTVAELLAVFATFPEGVDLVGLLAGKVNTTDVYNALDCIVAGKVADARQLKVLNDLIVALTGIVAGKENTSNKTDTVTGNETSTSLYASIKGIVDYFTPTKIKYILGITTLSGSNTGDETASSIITKIGDGTKINQSYLPSYVDDVLEFSDLAGFPASGETGKIYVAINSSKQYRWTGSAYLQITNGLIATTADVPEGSSLYFTTARVLAVVLSGLSLATGGAIVSTDTVLVALGKLQKQITDNTTAIALKADKTDTISYALSAPTGDLVTGDVDTFHAPYNFTLNNYWIGVKTAPTVSSILVDVKKNGTSITSTKAGIDATENTSLTGTTPVLVTTSFVKGDAIVPSIFQVGSSETGKSLKIYLEVTKS